MDNIISDILKTRNLSPDEELELKRSKHFFVQWLVGGNRRTVPVEVKPFVNSYPDEARALFDRFRERNRRKPKGKKRLFAN